MARLHWRNHTSSSGSAPSIDPGAVLYRGATRLANSLPFEQGFEPRGGGHEPVGYNRRECRSIEKNWLEHDFHEAVLRRHARPAPLLRSLHQPARASLCNRRILSGPRLDSGHHPTAASRSVGDLPVPTGIELLSGREQVNALRGVLDRLGVHGEVNFIRRISKEHRLVIPIVVPGREVTVDLNLETRSASVTSRGDSMWSAMVYLHKMPCQHNANIRGSWVYLSIWRWLADTTVYLVLFLSISGIYLWAVLRAERRIGMALLAAGAFSFFGLVYAIAR